MTIALGIFGTQITFWTLQAVQDTLAASVPLPSCLGTPAEWTKLVPQIVKHEMLNRKVRRLAGVKWRAQQCARGRARSAVITSLGDCD